MHIKARETKKIQVLSALLGHQLNRRAFLAFPFRLIIRALFTLALSILFALFLGLFLGFRAVGFYNCAALA